MSEEREEVVWAGKFITAKVRGKWEYVARSRGIRAAVILAIDEDDHVLLVEQFRVPLGRACLELPAGLVGDDGPTHHGLFDIGYLRHIPKVLAVLRAGSLVEALRQEFQPAGT